MDGEAVFSRSSQAVGWLGRLRGVACHGGVRLQDLRAHPLHSVMPSFVEHFATLAIENL
jgi:hypothetical protein